MLSVTLVYNSEANPESSFTWVTGTGQNFAFVDEATTLNVTIENATFSDNAVNFISSRSNFGTPTPTENGLAIDIEKAPLHYLEPLLLSFNVNAEGANGITSPPLLLVHRPDSLASTSINIQYNSTTGAFQLESATTLQSLDVLVNNLIPFDITFNLQAESNVKFDTSSPLIGPSWLTPSRISDTQLKASIASDATRFGSFQFVLDVPTDGRNLTVTSPDPILVNATIGDGPST